MFIERKNFPYVNISGKMFTAKKSHSVRNTTEASVVKGKKWGSTLVAIRPSPQMSWHCSTSKRTAPSHSPGTCPLSIQRYIYTEIYRYICIQRQAHTQSLGCWRELIMQTVDYGPKGQEICQRLQDAWDRGKPVLSDSLRQRKLGSEHRPLGPPCPSSSPSPKYQLSLGKSSTKDQNLTSWGKKNKPKRDQRILELEGIGQSRVLPSIFQLICMYTLPCSRHWPRHWEYTSVSETN